MGDRHDYVALEWVNGEIAELGRRVDPDRDLVEVDGAPIGIRPISAFISRASSSTLATSPAHRSRHADADNPAQQGNGDKFTSYAV